MSIDLEQIRSANPIEQLIGEKFALKRQGTRFVGVEHDSLVVTPQTGLYFWNSRSEHGDVFDFVGRHLLNHGSSWNNRDASMFMEAVRLSGAAGWHPHRRGQRLSPVAELGGAPTDPATARDAAEHTDRPRLCDKDAWLAAGDRAQRAARFHAVGQTEAARRTEFADKWRSVIAKFPAGMIVYVHLERGRLGYLSGRSISGKQHYNPPRELIGERRPYGNHLYTPDVDQLVLVEGQADAITFGEWGFPALAVAGMHVSDDLLTVLRKHRRVFVALDNTPDALRRIRSWHGSWASRR